MALKIAALVTAGVLLTYCGLVGFCMISHDHTVAGKIFLENQKKTREESQISPSANTDDRVSAIIQSAQYVEQALEYQIAHLMNLESQCWIARMFF